ncbi:MAG: GMC family oxidoreductase [Emcibacter sp.]|nr:GMC family oxidoreductase [Emcibacter sp.]
MILEFADVKRDYNETVDVVVIGSGCGAATVAKELAEAGHDVLMLERGGYYSAERGDFDQRSDNMLARIDGGRGLETSPNGQIALMYGNCVGGASVHYWGDSWRIPRDRCEVYEQMGVSGHSYDDLEPYFRRIEEDHSIHLHGPEYYNRMNQIFDVAAAKLGWHVEGVPQARTGCTKSGHCYQGCSYDAKQSQLVTYIPKFTEAGGRIFADCQVEQITTNDQGHADGVSAIFLNRDTGEPSGYKLQVKAKIVVLAAGGFASPVIWLKSGLPNSNGQVGKNLLCNPNPYLYGLFDEPIMLWENVPASTGTSDFRLPKFDAEGKYLEGGYLLHPNQLQPEFLAATIPGSGDRHRDLMAKLTHIGGVVSWIDDELGGQVSLGDDGQLVYDYSIRGVDILKIHDALKKQAELLFAAGVKEIIVPDIAGTVLHSPEDIPLLDAIDISNGNILFGAPHPSSTLQMNDDPSIGVVGSNHEAHEVPGLFVADPSALPRGPSVDPSVTIMAWSYIAANSIKEKLTSGDI